MRRKIIYVDNFLTGHGHTPTTGATLVDLFKEEGYNVVATSSKQNKVLRLADMLFTIARDRKGSLVLIAAYSTSAFYFAWVCSLMCRLLNIPYILCLHGGDLPERIKRSKKISTQVFYNSYVNVAVSGYLHKSMIDNKWKSVIIPNNININAYPFKKRSISSSALLWVRSFHSIYNPLMAVRIVYLLSKKYNDVKLTMVGPDKDGSLEQCKRLAKELNVSRNITFTGLLTREQWVSLSSTHDIFINTTNFDNLPVSVVEAMALGMVTVSTSVGGIPYLIDNLKDGLLVPPNDEFAFVSAIEKVLNDEKLSQKLSEEARKKAEEYSWDSVRVLWKQLLNAV